jgi:hypothetical protein
LPRAILALAGLLIPALVLFRYRSRTVLWLLGGAVLYAVLFNLRYAVLDKRTYSLSSVSSANDLILYCAITAALALLVAWLVVLLSQRAFRGGASQAASLSLGLALVTIYLLALPVLWSFLLNGALVTWTLPDFASTFLAFLSGIQILIVAVLGIVLTGVGALVGRLVAR